MSTREGLSSAPKPAPRALGTSPAADLQGHGWRPPGDPNSPPPAPGCGRVCGELGAQRPPSPLSFPASTQRQPCCPVSSVGCPHTRSLLSSGSLRNPLVLLWKAGPGSTHRRLPDAPVPWVMLTRCPWGCLSLPALSRRGLPGPGAALSSCPDHSGSPQGRPGCPARRGTRWPPSSPPGPAEEPPVPGHLPPTARGPAPPPWPLGSHSPASLTPAPRARPSPLLCSSRPATWPHGPQDHPRQACCLPSPPPSALSGS